MMTVVLILFQTGCKGVGAVVRRVRASTEGKIARVAFLTGEGTLGDGLEVDTRQQGRIIPIQEVVSPQGTVPPGELDWLVMTSPNPLDVSPALAQKVRSVIGNWADILVVLAGFALPMQLPQWLTPEDAIIVLMHADRASKEVTAAVTEICREHGLQTPIFLLDEDGNVQPAPDQPDLTPGTPGMGFGEPAERQRQDLRSRTAEALRANRTADRNELETVLTDLRNVADHLEFSRRNIVKVDEHLDKVVTELRTVLWERRGSRERYRSLTDEAWDLSEHRLQLNREREDLRKQADQDMVRIDRIIKQLST